MTSRARTPNGLWLPLITPFRDGEVDETSLRRLVRHYRALPVDGIIAAATTGEGMTLSAAETARVAAVVAEEIAAGGREIPLYLGLSGSWTAQLADRIRDASDWPVDGYLVASPYYTRPSQRGLVAHFSAIAAATERPVMIYNIPYRTGVNLGNDAMLELAGLDNIVGVKDCCADPAQTFDLLRRRPPGFSVMTGEDAFFHTALANGADGGILASAHVLTGRFAGVLDRVRANDLDGALEAWMPLAPVAALLFAEPSPSPVKHWLARSSLINSADVRLPMLPVSGELAVRLDHEIRIATVEPDAA